MRGLNDDHWILSPIEREADQAMFRAKEAGRNQVVAFAVMSLD